MKKISIITVTLFAAVLAGCTAPTKEVGGAEVMANLTSDPLDCMIYEGSDSTFHYFKRVRFKSGTRFKVRRGEVDLPASAQVGEIPYGMKLHVTAAPSAR